MKKFLGCILCLSVILGILFYHLSSTYALNTSYYNEKNAPEFYGLTKAIIQKDDVFSIEDSKFRIFARDFEDGDLTQKINVISNNVDTSKEGSYKVIYEVVDSHNNKTRLEVVIEVIDDISEGRYYERTLYSLPSVDNMSLAGTHRGNNEDRQMLGFYMEKDAKIAIKKLSGDKNLTLTYLNNDQEKEDNFTITDNYVDIVSNKSGAGVPFIKTVYESKEPVVVGIKVNDTKVHSLPYYHNGDNETEFFRYWNQLTDSYAVTESEDLTVLIPYHDRNKLVNYYSNCFNSLDAFFSYWHNIMNQYDEYLGLSYNPEDPIDQNVKTKYFVKANAHGVGSAYYAGDHVGINSDSVASFFEVNWGGLHEVGHGYQGSLKADLDQGEVSNNILGHYVQMNKDFYPYPLNWLGDISRIEEGYQQVRLSGKSYSDLNVAGKLYFAVNLLDYKNPKETYAEINKIWRRFLRNNQKISTMDAYTLAFYNLYHVNIVPYFDAWKIDVSNEVKEKVSDGDIPSILYDVAKDKSDLIYSDLSKDGKYSLVSNLELKKYSLKGNLNLNLKIDNLDEIKGKKIIIKNESYQKELVIENDFISLNDIPIGTYQLILPNPKNNIYEYDKYNYIVISNNETTDLELIYQNSELMNLINDSKIELRGIGDGLFADITLENQILTVTTYDTKPHYLFNGLYARIEIYNVDNQVIYSKEYNGNEKYSKEIKQIPYQEGYKIVILHKEGNGRLIIQSRILEEKEKNLSTLRDQPNTYIIGKYGLYQENQDNYQNYLDKIETYISKLKDTLTEEELINKNLYIEKKRKLLLSVLELQSKEQNDYLEKYKYIFKGSCPSLIQTDLEIKQNEILNLYELLKATDLEDGIYELNNQNSKFDYSFVSKAPGEYKIPYEIKDSDDNITKGIINLTVLKVENETDKASNNIESKTNKKTNNEVKTTENEKQIDNQEINLPKNEKNIVDEVIKNKSSGLSNDKKTKNNHINIKIIIILSGIGCIAIILLMKKYLFHNN